MKISDFQNGYRRGRRFGFEGEGGGGIKVDKDNKFFFVVRLPKNTHKTYMSLRNNGSL